MSSARRASSPRRPTTSPGRRRSRAGATDATPPHVCYPGGATFFWWQIGAATRLLEIYDLDTVQQTGFSAGALAAVLSRCGVDPTAAHEVAFTLATEAGVFRNPLGLCCKWGNLVEAWLRALLPEDAAERCDRTAVVVLTQLTPVPRVARLDRFLGGREQYLRANRTQALAQPITPCTRPKAQTAANLPVARMAA